MRLNLITLLAIGGLYTFVSGCSGSGVNTVNEPTEVKTIEQQMQEDKERDKDEAAAFEEQAKYSQ